ALIRAIRERAPATRFAGVAGPAMVAEGCEAWAAADELAVMGLFEVLHHLPRLMRLRGSLRSRFLAQRPDIFVGIDAPEFNLGLAPALHAAGIRTVQYVSPQVWAWRSGRARRMAGFLDLVLCLLPFEPPVYDRVGLRAVFVGHPLADQLPLLPDRIAARASLGLPAQGLIVAVLPGSRVGEVARLADDFAGTISWLAGRRSDLGFIAPMASAPVRSLFEQALKRHAPAVTVRVIDGHSRMALTAADAALVASGTATLETLLCKRPMVVAYRLGWMTALALRSLRLLKTRYFAQPNLLAGGQVVPELSQGEVRPERLGREIERWLDQPAEVAALQAQFTAIHRELRAGASERAAEAILELARGRGA
ncbi:MAG: lipid-A-disaccharide synthase, partial [Steroidobacteraceae bacterium]